VEVQAAEKYIRIFMRRACTALVVVVLTAGCASAPPPVAPVIAFETKMSWILRLEDQRVLRDTATPIAPPPIAVGQRSNTPLVVPPAPPDLTRLLTDPEARVRRRAALAIGRVGLAEAAPNLVSVLRSDAEPEVRQMAAFALGLVADKAPPIPSPIPSPIIDALRLALVDPSPIVAGRAAEALGLIGDTASAAEIGRLVGANAAAAAAIAADEARDPLDPAADAFRLGVYALARLKAYEPLAAAVLGSDGQPRVQWWPVAYALQRIEDKRALPALLTLAKSPGVYTRAFAARGLGALKDPSAIPVLLPLVDVAAAGPTSGATIEAIRALGRIGDARASEPLLRLVRAASANPQLRAEALLAVAETGVDTTQDFLVDLLADAAPTVRAAALQAVSKGDNDTFMTILSGLDPDTHWSVRAELAAVLATKDPQRALPRLTQMLGDRDSRVIPAVLTALTKLKAPDIAKVLVQYLANDDVVVRTYAASNLGELKPEGVTTALIAAFRKGDGDASYTARAAALEALAKYGAAAAVPTLRIGLSDRDWAVRVRAAELLKALDPSADTAHAIRPAPSSRTPLYDAPSLVSPRVSPHVYFETDKGTIEIELDVIGAPLTSENFIALVGKGFFEGLTFHRLVPDFVVQAGDPRGDSDGGPGYTIRDELNEAPYLRGTIGMALDWRDTGGSQFFIAYSPQPQLDARYTVFGRIVSGMDVVDKLTQWDVMRRVRVWDGVTTVP
jgi:cyclophilin family peptidyl-prolyl cis-trans isomerase/HEAT repeat protein